MTAVIELRDVDHVYPEGGQSLRAINLTLDRGQVTALLGRNGAGKTTLILHLNGLLRPAKGCVLFAGAPLDYGRSGLTALRRRVALVLQNPDDQLFAASVAEDVSFGPLNLGLSESETRERVAQALDLMGLSALADRPTPMLSFGQKKRTVLAGALVMRPDVLLLDEPFAGLDPEGASGLAAVLTRLRSESVTIVMATHDVDRACSLADAAVVLDEGRVAAAGPAASLLSDAALMSRAGLETPLVLRLWQSLDPELTKDRTPPRTDAELLARLRQAND